MRVLITGGCGFVGTNLVARLQAIGGYEIRILDDESLGKRAHVEDFGGEFIRGDIQDADVVDRAVAGMDAVVHLAADTRVIESIENPVRNFHVNIVGSFTILEAMRRHRTRKLINASTGGAILGEVEPPVHEEMVPKPMSPYGASKLAVEGYCSAYAASYDVQALSLRFSNLYGPRSFHKGSVVAAFLKRILAGEPLTVHGDGTQVRDYVFVGDICDGIVAGLNSSVTGPVQLGSGRPVTVNELIDAMRAVVAPTKIVVDYQPFRKGEVYATYCDITKARRELGFEASTPLASGLAETWDWFSRRDVN